MKYLNDWEQEVKEANIEKKKASKMLLSRETREGLHITGIFKLVH